MTESECWQLIADCTLKEDWYGVLAAADELPEDVRTAIRWAIGRRWLPYRSIRVDGMLTFRVWIMEDTQRTNSVLDSQVDLGWKWVAEMRRLIIDQLEVLEYLG